jgi:hypothetical protein
MKLIIVLMALMVPLFSWGYSCDCEVRAQSPITGSYRMPSKLLKKYELEEFSSLNQKNIQSCRELCLSEFHEDMPADRLKALLVTYSMELIEEKKLGYNCTGLTTLKYPIRVKARLGKYNLGNVADILQVVNHEEVCF